MVVALQAVLLLAPVLRVGNMRFSAFGVCTIVGLLAAFSLMRWTATMAGVAREPLFDAGWFGVLAGLVFSRLLLILHEPTAFLHYPLLVLSLPSFTYVGMGLTVAAVLVYLRRKGLPLAQVLDAWAPCAALLAAALSVGYFIEGTHAGMPTTLPWGVLDARFGRVHPVQMYDAVAAVWLCAVLLWRLSRAHVPGRVAQFALLVSGFAVFILHMFRQPDLGSASSLLEPGQWVALATVAMGLLLMPFCRLWAKILEPSPPPPTREEVALLLENYVAGCGGPYDHETIEYGNFTDPLLLELKKRMPDLNEGPHHGSMTQEEADRILLDYARRLRLASQEIKQETL